MTLEEFINEKLCPAGVVTAWDRTVIVSALRLGDVDKLTDKLAELTVKAGVEIPADLIILENMQNQSV